MLTVAVLNLLFYLLTQLSNNGPLKCKFGSKTEAQAGQLVVFLPSGTLHNIATERHM